MVKFEKKLDELLKEKKKNVEKKNYYKKIKTYYTNLQKVGKNYNLN